MKIVEILILTFLFVGCKSNSSENKILENIKNGIWIDSLCVEYSFKNDTIYSRLLNEKKLESITIGNLRTDNGIELVFDQETGKYNKYKLHSNEQNRLNFISVKDSSQPNRIVGFRNNITLFRKKEIAKSALTLEKFHFKATPTFHYSGFLELKIDSDKTMTYSTSKDENDIQTVQLTDSFFNDIEDYFKILKLNEYKNNYHYPFYDGVNYDFEIITNQYQKSIRTTASAPEGLLNLISYMEFNLQTE